MSDWKECRLGDCIEFIIDNRGKNPPLSDSGYELIETNMISSNNKYPDFDKVTKYVSEDTYNNWFRKGHPKIGDILISTVGNIGKVAIVNEDKGCIAQNLIGLRVNEKIIAEYLYYFLIKKDTQDQILSLNIGSVQPSIKVPHLLNLEIKIPELLKQKECIQVLSKLDDKIQLNTQINQTLEQIAQALFKSWFVDFKPVRAKVQALSDGMSLEQAELAAMQTISGKTPEELTALSQAQPDRYAELAEIAKAFPCEMVEVDGIEVPKGWEVKELGSLMTIKRGGSPRPIKDFISDKGLNWVKISDATAEDNPFLFSTKEYIKSEGLSKTVLLNKGSLILSNSATPGLPRFLELDACIHDGWLYFSDIKSLTQEYLYFFFLNIRNDLVAQGNGSVFTNLKTDIVKAQKAIVPDERVICYFDKQVKSIMNLIRYNTANSISLKETRDLLLPRLLNGEI
ncbi:restriction endonuclease subunit S [Aggregatibacter sp. Marseille-P9115]|jgi:raw score 3.64|uniref:restriction endonuclease subunit S n=1 Tax=Aggregatibacter sp. Marseille-P9115 TaxID=2866570 RepID=UPI001E31B98F|nr:restriction endonuclease subunit S [Aggregatibacter sp. Marseille-P9115]